MPNHQNPIDFGHWFNLIGACFLLSFNNAFPKNRLNSVASVITTFGVIADIGLCTIDLIMSSFGNNEFAQEELSKHISNTPAILYPFIIVGPSLLFIGLAIHALNFFKTNMISSLMVIVGSLAIGFSFFVLKNGVYMLLSCVVFTVGLGILLCKNDSRKIS